LHAARQAVEQRRADLGLEIEDLPAVRCSVSAALRTEPRRTTASEQRNAWEMPATV